MSNSFKFPKAERLKSRKQIGELFKNRQSVGAYPLRVFWAEVPYSEDDALELLKNSTIFDQFVTDCMNDFEMFERDAADEAEKN